MTQLIKDQRLIIGGGVINTFGIFLMTKGSLISSNKDKSEIIEKIKGFREEIGVMKSGITDRESLNKIENEFNEWAENFVSDFESKKVEQQKSEILLKEKEIKLSKKWGHIYQYTFEVIQQMLTGYNQKAKNKIEFILPALPHNLFDKDAESFKSFITFNNNTVWKITLQIKKPYKIDEIPNIVIDCFFGNDRARKHAEKISFSGDGWLILIIDLETERFIVFGRNQNEYFGEVKDKYSISADNYKTSIKDLFTTPPKKKAIPTLAEYSKTYLEFYRTAKENTRLTKMKTVNSLVRYLGEYRLDKVTPFVIEKFRVERKEKDSVKEGTVNDDVATLKNLFNYAIKAGIIDKNPLAVQV